MLVSAWAEQANGLGLLPSAHNKDEPGGSCASYRRQRIAQPCFLGQETKQWGNAKSRNGQRRGYTVKVSKAGVSCQRCRVRPRSIHRRGENASDLYLPHAGTADAGVKRCTNPLAGKPTLAGRARLKTMWWCGRCSLTY